MDLSHEFPVAHVGEQADEAGALLPCGIEVFHSYEFDMIPDLLF